MSDGAIEFPEALDFLFEGARYKVLYGGRGSGKSWGVGRALLAIGSEKPTRILCAREFQNSIEDSVLKLLGDQVDGMGLSNFYEVQKKAIIGANGSSFAFAGLRHNASKLKSFEGVDIVWVEEAHNVSKASWDVLIPTIRKSGSEIWIVFNPELDTDETWKRFVKDPPPEFKDGKRYSFVRKVGWRDNNWFPAELEAERTELQRKDPVAYQTVWEGHCRQTLDGAIYAAELLAATSADRITRVPYDPTKPVHTFWDLGWADKTSIWFAQAVGFEYHVIDFIQDNQKTLQHFLTMLQGRGYVYGTDYLPHDAQNKTFASAGRSIEQMMRAAGRTVHILPRLGVADGINAARTIFPNCWFDADKCADGLQALRRYRYDVDQATGQMSREPLHDENSHAADAFRYLAVSLRAPTAKKKAAAPPPGRSGGTSWMG